MHVPKGSLSIEKKQVCTDIEITYLMVVIIIEHFLQVFKISLAFVYGNRLLCFEILLIEANAKAYHSAEKGWTAVVPI